MATVYRVYDKNAGVDDLAICDKFTEQGAQIEVEAQRKNGRDCAYEQFTPRCTWGSAYESTHCQNEATLFDPGWACYSAVCAEHYRPEWMRPRVSIEEMQQRELAIGKAPEKPTTAQAAFWFQER